MTETKARDQSKDPFEGVDTNDKGAVLQVLVKLAQEEQQHRPPRPKDKTEAKKLFAAEQLAYKQRMLERGIDVEHIEGLAERLAASQA